MSGDAVVIDFPYSDFSQAKRRPALVLAPAGRGDFILCQITSKANRDESSIDLRASDFAEGSLRQVGFIRPNRLFTAHFRVMEDSVGRVRLSKLEEAIEGAVRTIRSSLPSESRGPAQ